MARVSASRSPSSISLLFISSLLLASIVPALSLKGKKYPITVKGLKYDFYGISCPVERIVRNHLEDVFKKDNGQAPGILRLFFHDCFAQGCDASILLNDDGGDEKDNVANSGLREEALQTIENLRIIINNRCTSILLGQPVTCADILVIAAREAVRQLGGPDFEVPLGRRDSLTFDADAPDNLPAPFLRTDALLGLFAAQNFDATDVVALSGAHTYGRTHCPSLFNRTTESDPPIDPELKKQLEATCPSVESPNTFNLDVRTPVKFDNMYYINLLNRQGVFTSDQDIAGHPKTKEIVNLFASNQDAFFDKFGAAFVKVSQLNVLTGNKGEIRKTCSAPNKKRSNNVASVVEEVVELAQNNL